MWSVETDSAIKACDRARGLVAAAHNAAWWRRLYDRTGWHFLRKRVERKEAIAWSLWYALCDQLWDMKMLGYGPLAGGILGHFGPQLPPEWPFPRPAVEVAVGEN